MKLLGSTENKITKNKNGENVPHLKITEVVLVHCDIVNNDQQDSRLLYTFVPNKPFGSLLEISPANHIFLKTFNSEYPNIKVWFTDQNRINLTMLIDWKISKWDIKLNQEIRIYVKGYGFLPFRKSMGKNFSNVYGKNFLIALKSLQQMQ